MDDIRIVPLTADEVRGAAMLSQEVGWAHRREDWELLLEFSDGWAAVDGTGKTVATTVFTPYGTTGGTISMVIVAASLRGRGIGRQLFSAALRAAEGRRLRVTATPDGEPLYRSLGFTPYGRIFQHQGVLTVEPSSDGAEDAAAGDADAIARLDAVVFGEDRSALIRAFWRAGRFAVVRENGTIRGFACLREFGRGSVIGPVVAASTQVAAALIGHLAAGKHGRFLRLDIMQATGLEEMLDGIGLPRTDDGIVMWTAAPNFPAAGEPRMIAVAAQALG